MSPSAFVQEAVRHLIAKAEERGVPVPDEVRRLSVCGSTNAGARLYALAHPDEDDPTVPDELRWCCYGSASGRLDGCTCWEPVWNVEQQLPALPIVDEQVVPRDRLCGDCAFRKGSPERSTTYEEETLLGLADKGTPFWCHDGMRRPVQWRHPHGVTIDGDPADWQPPIVNGVPFRADGSPALLCAGWAARASRIKPMRSPDVLILDDPPKERPCRSEPHSRPPPPLQRSRAQRRRSSRTPGRTRCRWRGGRCSRRRARSSPSGAASVRPTATRARRSRSADGAPLRAPRRRGDHARDGRGGPLPGLPEPTAHASGDRCPVGPLRVLRHELGAPRGRHRCDVGGDVDGALRGDDERGR